MRQYFAAIALFTSLLISSCGDDDSLKIPESWKDDDSISVVKSQKPRYIWIDAAANFPRFADSKDNIRTDLQKAYDAGFTDIVVDVRPSEGDILYQSDLCEQITKLDYWDTDGSYKFYERTATWDYLQAFIDIGHEIGLKVNAAFNTFTGGCLYPYGLGEQGLVFRDSTKRSWVTVLNLESGLVNEMDCTSTDPSADEYYGTKFLNPCNDEVQTYILGLLADLAEYDLDGIFLDRCRYDDLRSDFSDVSKAKFEAYIGQSVDNFPDDILLPGTLSEPYFHPKFFKSWLSFRAKTIRDFMEKAAVKVKSINPNITFGVYVGAWYSEYYTMGVNWASTSYDPSAEFSWADSDYRKYGYAALCDMMLLGCYASASNVYGTTEWTMQGFCTQAKKKILGACKFAGGPDVGNSDGFTEGGAETAVTNSVDACINSSNGYFLFDMCHVREYDYWDDLKKGIDAYLSSLKNSP